MSQNSRCSISACHTARTNREKELAAGDDRAESLRCFAGLRGQTGDFKKEDQSDIRAGPMFCCLTKYAYAPVRPGFSNSTDQYCTSPTVGTIPVFGVRIKRVTTYLHPSSSVFDGSPASNSRRHGSWGAQISHDVGAVHQ